MTGGRPPPECRRFSPSSMEAAGRVRASGGGGDIKGSANRGGGCCGCWATSCGANRLGTISTPVRCGWRCCWCFGWDGGISLRCGEEDMGGSSRIAWPRGSLFCMASEVDGRLWATTGGLGGGGGPRWRGSFLVPLLAPPATLFGGVLPVPSAALLFGLFWTPLLATLGVCLPPGLLCPPAAAAAATVAAAGSLLVLGQFCSWKVTELFHINERPQPRFEHAYGFSPVCFREWTLRLAFLLKIRAHVGHLNSFSGSAGADGRIERTGGAAAAAAAPEPIETRSRARASEGRPARIATERVGVLICKSCWQTVSDEGEVSVGGGGAERDTMLGCGNAAEG